MSPINNPPFALNILDADLAFAVASAALGMVGFAPYIRDILRGRTMPCRASWLVWSILSSVAFVSLVSEGATTSLAFVGVQCGGTMLVFLLSLYVGRGVRLGRLGWVAICATGLGLAFWRVTDDAVYALTLSIAIGAIGGAMTARKAFLQPATETLPTWLAFLGSACFGLASASEPDPVLLAYPAYLATTYLAIVLAILIGRTRARQTLARITGQASSRRPRIKTTNENRPPPSPF